MVNITSDNYPIWWAKPTLWRKVSSPRRGGRLIHRELFTFKQMLSFLRQAIDKLYQVIDAIYLPSG